MKVIVVSYKAEISGGSNRSLLSIIDVMKEKDFDIEMILPKKYGNMYDEAAKRNIKCTYIPYCRTGKRKSKYRIIQYVQTIYENIKEIYNYIITIIYKSKIKNMNANIVYINGSAMHAGRYIKRILNIPHVWHIREYYNDDLIYPTNMYKKIEKNTDKLILISNDLYNEYNKHINKNKLIMISNGIKYEELPKLIKHTGINILLVGRISEEKCQLDAVQAINKIKNIYTNKKLNLFFAGKTVTKKDNEYCEKLKQYIKENSLENIVTFLGEVNNISEIRRKMDIELMCSLREPFGRVTIEAMRSGLAVIGANSGGTKDIIVNEKNGLLYEPNNIDELTACMERLIIDKNKRLKLAATGKNFSKDNFTEKQLLKTVNLIKEEAKKVY